MYICLYDKKEIVEKSQLNAFELFSQTKNNRPIKTSQLYGQDSYAAVTTLYSGRFDMIKSLANKRQPPLRQTTNQGQKNPKHTSVLQSSGINYDLPLDPVQVALIRAERIQREKKQNQAAAAAAVSFLVHFGRCYCL